MANASTAQATTDSTQQQVARPLHVLQPLIAKDLREGNEAAEQAGLPYYKAAGEKLIEAKAQIKHGQFEDWCVRNFKLKPRIARYYMSLARTTADTEIGNAMPISSLRVFIQQDTARRREVKFNAGTGKREEVKFDGEEIRRIQEKQKRATEEAETRRNEYEVRRKLALKLIDRGYKSLAKELHPDRKGGSNDWMVRLNDARNRLLRAV
jgi:curved DNA-binding protein CbpA